MKMNRLISSLSIILITVLFFSCVTTSSRTKQLVGKWKPVKIENASVPANKTVLAGKRVQDSLGASQGQVKQDSAITALSIAEKRLDHLIQTEMRSSMQLNADKTAEMTFRGKTVKGTWKMKKKGTILSAKNPDTGRSLELEVVKVNDTSAVMYEKTKDGKLRITYHKEK